MDTIKKCLVVIWILALSVPLLQAQSLLTVLENDRQTSGFAMAVKKCGLEHKLSGNGPFTLLVPANDGIEQAMAKYDNGQLRNLVLNHIMTGKATENSLKKMSKITTLGGLSLVVHVNGNQIEFNNSRLISSNIKATNGVIHVIDRVLH